MTPTRYRDQVAQLAKVDVEKAVAVTKNISDPWFEAQAWSHLARYAEKPLLFSKRAAKAAEQTKDDYQRSAVRAWEIAALAERKYSLQARRALTEAVELAVLVTPIGSRAESLLLLLQAAFKISKVDAEMVSDAFEASCTVKHWRVSRAKKQVALMLSDQMPPREFFW
jgi:hypothetical protein